MNNMTEGRSLMILLILLSLFFSACAAAPRMVPEPPKWRLFVEFNRGERQLLIDMESLKKIEDGATEQAYTCIAKVVPTAKRLQALRETISAANREAGIDELRDEAIMKSWVERETSYHDAEISCKVNKLFFYLHKQHILEFDVSESGSDRELFKIVCGK